MFRSLQKLILTVFFTAFAAQASAMFVQPDWLDPTQPGVGTNRYAYSNNDPINKLDPNGNAYEGYYKVYPMFRTNPAIQNPVLRGIDAVSTEILNIPSSLGNLAADGLYGTGELLAPHEGALVNGAMTTPTAFDDVAANVVGKYGRFSVAVGQRARGTFVNPQNINFSQRTAGGNGRVEGIRKSMSQNGWSGPAIDVVRTPNGSLVAMDNTRLAVARELGINKIPVTIRRMDEAIPNSMRRRKDFRNAETWGDALRSRTGNNRLGEGGTNSQPRMSGEPATSGGGSGGWFSNLFGGN